MKFSSEAEISEVRMGEWTVRCVALFQSRVSPPTATPIISQKALQKSLKFAFLLFSFGTREQQCWLFAFSGSVCTLTLAGCWLFFLGS